MAAFYERPAGDINITRLHLGLVNLYGSTHGGMVGKEMVEGQWRENIMPFTPRRSVALINASAFDLVFLYVLAHSYGTPLQHTLGEPVKGMLSCTRCVSCYEYFIL